MNKGRIVGITGAAGGMGALLFERCVANRDTLFATDTPDEDLSKSSDKVDDGTHGHAMAADISDEASCARLGSDRQHRRARPHARASRRRLYSEPKACRRRRQTHALNDHTMTLL